MQTAIRSKIYHLRRRDGSAVFLHPFLESGSTLTAVALDELKGRYGQEPQVEAITLLRNSLYRRVEDDVRDWIYESRFIPRFLLSAGAFAGTYVLLSIAVRDPLPVIDEVAIAFALAILAYIGLGRRFEQSKGASEKRMVLRQKIDTAKFVESPFVVTLESILGDIEASVDDFLSLGVREPAPKEALERLWKEFPDDTATVYQYLKELCFTKPYRKLSKQIKRGRITDGMRKQLELGEVVPALLVLYHGMRDTIR